MPHSDLMIADGADICGLLTSIMRQNAIMIAQNQRLIDLSALTNVGRIIDPIVLNTANPAQNQVYLTQTIGQPMTMGTAFVNHSTAGIISLYVVNEHYGPNQQKLVWQGQVGAGGIATVGIRLRIPRNSRLGVATSSAAATYLILNAYFDELPIDNPEQFKSVY